MGNAPGKSSSFRLRVAGEQNWRCAYCGHDMDPCCFTVDHVVPIRHKGPNLWENIVACCKPCNNAKSHTNAHRFLKLRLRGVAEGWWKPGEEPMEPALKHLRALWRGSAQ